MIAPVDRVQRGMRQPSEQRTEPVHVAEGVPGALDEERRHGDGGKMVGAELFRLPCRVKESNNRAMLGLAQHENRVGAVLDKTDFPP